MVFKVYTSSARIFWKLVCKYGTLAASDGLPEEKLNLYRIFRLAFSGYHGHRKAMHI